MKSLRVLLISWMFSINAYSMTPIINTTDAPTLAEQCRQLAIDLFNLSSNQTRKICRINLDGLNVYYASNYITFKWSDKAQKVLSEAIIQVKYALDIGCDNPSGITNVINGLYAVRNGLNDN